MAKTEPDSQGEMFKWTPDYAVHVPEIDREDQELFGIIGGLHEAMREGKGKQALGSLLSYVIGPSPDR